MPIGRGRTHRDGEDDADVELSPWEQREQLRVQSELLAVLHTDREARTRTNDSGPVGRLLSAAVPFIVGVLIGALSTYAAISGRLATLEAGQGQLATMQAAQTQLTAALREDIRAIRDELRDRPAAALDPNKRTR